MYMQKLTKPCFWRAQVKQLQQNHICHLTNEHIRQTALNKSHKGYLDTNAKAGKMVVTTFHPAI